MAVGTVSVEVSFHTRTGDRRVADVVSIGKTSHSARLSALGGAVKRPSSLKSPPVKAQAWSAGKGWS